MYNKGKQLFVLFSGGLGSALATHVLVSRGYSPKLYFNDTKTEDADLYRFIKDCVSYWGLELIEDSDGRDIWQVFADTKYMGNTRKDVCSRVLKRERSLKFRQQFPHNSVLFACGIDVWEAHRYEKAKPLWEPYTLVAPLIDAEVYDKELLWQEFHKQSGIRKPRLYDIGFSHNNCGGFCVKAGLAHYKHLLEVDRERYLEFERKEAETYAKIGKKYPFLRKTINGKLEYITLRQYRQMLEANTCELSDDDKYQFGGCAACALV